MPVEYKSTEDLTYWASAGVNDDGIDIVSAAALKRGRLIIGKREIQDGLSGAFSIDAIITDIDFAPPIHSFFTRETIANLDENDPPEIFELVELREVPDIKGKNFRRTGLMLRYKKKLPPES